MFDLRYKTGNGSDLVLFLTLNGSDIGELDNLKKLSICGDHVAILMNDGGGVRR